MEQCTSEITDIIGKGKISATFQLKEFEEYASFMDDTEMEKIEKVLQAATDENFESYRLLIEHYNRLSRQVRVQFYPTYFGELFLVYRGELIQYIASVARKLKDELVDKMMGDCQQKSRA